MLNIINQAAGQDAYLHFQSQLTTNGFGFGVKTNKFGIFEFNVGYILEADSTTTDLFTNVIAHGNINSTSLIANRALISDASKNIVSSAVTDTELSYLSGVTSNIQTQINNTDAELSYLSGVTSSVQTQLSNKLNTNILDAIQFSAVDDKMLNVINQAAGQDAYLHFQSQLTTN